MIDRFKMILFVLVLGTILTTALVAVNDATAPRIAYNEQMKLHKNILVAFNIPFKEEAVESTFKRRIKTKKVKETTLYITNQGDCAFTIKGKGVWGPISGVLALQSDLITIKGLSVLHQEETPGLGDRVFEQAKLKEYEGKKFSPKLIVTAPGKAQKQNEIDGITGATLSCVAFGNILNDEYARHKRLLSGGNQ